MNDTRTPELPEISEETIDRIETALLAQIAEERASREAKSTASARPARSRRRTWLTVGGIAAAFVVGILVTPPILTAVSPTAMNESAITPASAPWSIPVQDGAGDMMEIATEAVTGSSAADGRASLDSAPESADADAGREIVAHAHAALRVDAIAAASDRIAEIAASYDGYVESTSIGQTRASVDASMPAPPGGDYGWVTIRVPAASLTEAISALSDVGEVTSSSVSRDDVTSAAIDLRARVEATRASVERLTELMTQTGSVSELIEAEMALSERQAQLESYEQQLASLEDQVAMSSLHVELSRIAPVAEPEPAGFGDGLRAGWNGLIVSLNALVVATGFLLPWLAVAGVVVLLVWLVRRGRTARRARRSES